MVPLYMTLSAWADLSRREATFGVDHTQTLGQDPIGGRHFDGLGPLGQVLAARAQLGGRDVVALDQEKVLQRIGHASLSAGCAAARHRSSGPTVAEPHVTGAGLIGRPAATSASSGTWRSRWVRWRS
jgi:hypothetical protein